MNKIKILVVDDSLFMRRMIKTILEDKYQNKIEVDEAENGKVAVEKAKITDYDLILLDITMPVMDGIEALKYIMSDKKYSNVVMVSSVMGQHVVIQSIQLGAKHFILKPFDQSDVISTVDKYVFDPEIATIEKLREKIISGDVVYLKNYIKHGFDLNEPCGSGFLLDGVISISKEVFQVLNEKLELLNEPNIKKMNGFRLEQVFQ